MVSLMQIGIEVIIWEAQLDSLDICQHLSSLISELTLDESLQVIHF